MSPTRARRRIELTASDVWPEDDQVAPPDARVAALRRLLPATLRDVVEARPDFWPDDATGHRRLGKDLQRLKAICMAGRIWHPASMEAPAVDPRIVEPERVTRARRMAGEGRSVVATDAAAVLATLDALLDPRPGRSEGARLLGEWMRAQGLSVRRAAALLSVSHQLLSCWLRGERRPRGPARRTLEETTGVPAFMWDRSQQVATSNVATPSES